MGSLERYCRLCALVVRQDHLLKLFDDPGPNRSATPAETTNGVKLRHFLNFSIQQLALQNVNQNKDDEDKDECDE